MIDGIPSVSNIPRSATSSPATPSPNWGRNGALQLFPLNGSAAVLQSQQRIAELTSLLAKGESLPLQGAPTWSRSSRS
jgi:hypothetical protein